MANRVVPYCSILVLVLLGASCGESDRGEVAVATELPAPTEASASVPSSPAVAADDPTPTGAERTTELKPACEHWDSAVQTLVDGESYAVQTLAVDRWLESVHTTKDSLAVGKPLVDFRAAVEVLSAAEWDFAAVADSVLLSWVEGILGNTLFGIGQQPVERDQCQTTLSGPAPAAVTIDCVLRLEPAFSWLIGLDRDQGIELTQDEADALASGVSRRWVQAGASPLCISQILWAVPSEEIDRHLTSLSAEERERVAVAGIALANSVDHLDYFAQNRLAQAEAIIP